MSSAIYRDWLWEAYIRFTDPPTVDDYQVRIPLDYLHGMNPDFSDFRATDVYGRVLKYSIYSKTAGVSAEIDVFVHNQDAGIIIYYGNSIATDASDDSIYILADRFTGANGAAPDTSKWTLEYSTSAGVVELNGSGEVEITPSSEFDDAMCLRSIETFTQGVIIEMRDKTSESHYNDTLIGEDALQGESGGGNDWHPELGDGLNYLVQDTNDTSIYQTVESSSRSLLATGSGSMYPSTNTYYIHKFIWASSLQSMARDDVVIATESSTDVYSTKSMRLGITRNKFSTNTGTRTVDWVLVRKYLATEPTSTIISITPNLANYAYDTIIISAGVAYSDTLTVNGDGTIVLTDIQAVIGTTIVSGEGTPTLSDIASYTDIISPTGQGTVILEDATTYSDTITVGGEGDVLSITFNATSALHEVISITSVINQTVLLSSPINQTIELSSIIEVIE